MFFTLLNYYFILKPPNETAKKHPRINCLFQQVYCLLCQIIRLLYPIYCLL